MEGSGSTGRGQPQVVADVEALLEQLLQPNTTVIRQATEALKVYFTKNAIIVVLTEILGRAQNWSVRQLAAVLLRQRLQTAWRRLMPNVKAHIKATLLQLAVSDPKTLVKHSIAAVIAAIAKHEQNQPWPDLLQLINQCCASTSADQREIGMFLLSSIAEDSSTIIGNYFDQYLQLLAAMLQDRESNVVRVHAFQALKELNELADTPARRNDFQKVVPLMIEATRQFIAAGDDESAMEAFEVFDDLVGTESPVLSKHMRTLLELFLGTALNTNLEEDTRIHALTFVSVVAQLRPQDLLKLKVIGDIVAALIRLFAETPEDAADRADFNLGHAAAQTLDSLIKHQPPRHTVPHVIREVQARSTSAAATERNAAMMAISVIVEGAQAYLRDDVGKLATFVIQGIHDPAANVRETALVALDEMSEVFGDDMGALHSVVIPALFDAIRDPRGVVAENAVSSLESYTEYMDDAILPYLDQLMVLYTQLLESDKASIRETVVCGIGSAAHAAGQKFLPYAGVVQRFLAFMALNEEEHLELRAVTTDTIGTVAIALGRQAFEPFLQPTLALAMTGVQTINEPRLRECTWQLFASLAQLYEAEFAPLLPQAMPLLFKAAVSREGIAEVAKEGEEVPAFVAALSQTATDDDAAWIDPNVTEDDGGLDDQQLVEPTTYMFERSTALAAIGAIATHLGTHFMPFVTETVAVLKQVFAEEYNEDVKVQAIDCVDKLMRAVHRLFDGEASWKDTRSTTASSEIQQLAGALVPNLVIELRDDEKEVVTQALNTLCDLLTVVGPVIISQLEIRQTIGTRVLEILQKKAPCQLNLGDDEIEEVIDDDGDDGEDDRNAELDAMLIDAAADVIGACAVAMGPEFVEYFRVFWPSISKYYKLSRPVAERSMAVGCAAEVASGLKEGVVAFAEPLTALFFKALRDKEGEVRRNAIYGIGCLCESAGAAMAPMYPTVLTHLQPLFGDNTDRAILDNLGGAVARMIMAQPTAVPLQAVLPVFLQVLPPMEDYDEGRPVARCLLMLLQQAAGNATVAAVYGRLIEVLATMLGPPMEQIARVDRDAIIAALQVEARSGRLQSALSTLSSDAQSILSAVLS